MILQRRRMDRVGDQMSPVSFRSLSVLSVNSGFHGLLKEIVLSVSGDGILK
jgi:hypothetical protein